MARPVGRFRLPSRTARRPGRRGSAAARFAVDGFTLVELLVVIAIISVLAAMLLPALEESLTAARRVTELNNHRQIGLVVNTFAQDHHDLLPAQIQQWSAGNRDMRDFSTDAVAQHVDGTTRIEWSRRNHAIWEDKHATYGLGTAIALGYAPAPEIFFTPGYARPDGPNQLGGDKAIRWDQPAHRDVWEELTDGDDEMNGWRYYAGIAYMAFCVNDPADINVGGTEYSRPNISFQTLAQHWRQTWCSAVLTASANRDLVYTGGGFDDRNNFPAWGKSWDYVAWQRNDPGPQLVFSPADGVVCGFFDGSVRWVGWAEIHGTTAPNGNQYIAHNDYPLAPGGVNHHLNDWVRRHATPGGR
jgi:prepilin-type N-terminal cleavage/methylation domain-containing protein